MCEDGVATFLRERDGLRQVVSVLHLFLFYGIIIEYMRGLYVQG